MATAYSYVRFSSPDQAKGDSLRRQLAASQQYADQHGLTLDTRTYQDLGMSAFHGDNSVSGNLGTFISAIDRAHIERGSYLLVESIDRLSRDQIVKSLGASRAPGGDFASRGGRDLGIARTAAVLDAFQLDPDNASVTLGTLQRAASVVGKEGSGSISWMLKREEENYCAHD